MRTIALGKGSNLLVGQHAACELCERRHELTWNAIRDDLTQTVFSGDIEIDGIGKRDRHSILAVFSVTGGAVFFIKRREGKHFVGAQDCGSSSRTAGNVIAAERSNANRDEAECTVPRGFEGRQSHFLSSFVSI